MSHPGATPSDRHKVVIIGSGFGGLTAAKVLKGADVDIKMIARTTHHLFQPLLYQVATAGLDVDDIAYAIRFCETHEVPYRVLDLDIERFFAKPPRGR